MPEIGFEKGMGELDLDPLIPKGALGGKQQLHHPRLVANRDLERGDIEYLSISRQTCFGIGNESLIEVEGFILDADIGVFQRGAEDPGSSSEKRFPGLPTEVMKTSLVQLMESISVR